MSYTTSLTTEHTPSTHKRRHACAQRLMNTRSMDRLTWLTIRQKGIGASDAAAAVGLTPYKSQLELWMEITGRLNSSSDAEQSDEMTSESPLFWGNVLEPIVADQYALRTDFKVRRVNAVLQPAEYPWMLANLDREVVGSKEVQILE